MGRVVVGMLLSESHGACVLLKLMMGGYRGLVVVEYIIEVMIVKACPAVPTSLMSMSSRRGSLAGRRIRQ